MVDRLTKEKRSWNMSRIKGRDTGPELAVRSLLHKAGYRFRLHRKDLPGKPDIVLPKYRTVILVHGCFWHRHEGCAFAYKPKSRQDFWKKKFKENTRRDRNNIDALDTLGWRVIVVWECEIGKTEHLSQRLEAELRDALSRKRHTGKK